MNNFLYKMERKFGRYTIKNLSLGLILCYAAGYIINMINPQFLSYLLLNPYYILHGQIWRLFTWILVPPSGLSFFTLIMLYFYYSIGTSLEHTWGAFRYNVYMFSGMIFTIIGSFLLYFVYGVLDKSIIAASSAELYFNMFFIINAFSTYYVNMSIFLAYAATFPEAKVLLMFLIPIKVKVLGIVYGFMLLYEFYGHGLAGRIMIAASLLNFIVFFLTTRNYKRVSPKEVKRRSDFRKAVKEGQKGDNVVSFHGKNVITRHKCAICGRTELDDETLEFRFCSKCEGNYEYCSEHLYTHQHVHKA